MASLHFVVLLLTFTVILALRDSPEYEELRKLNATCKEDLSCSKRPDDTWRSKCHCSSKCIFLDTCCLDSYHKQMPAPKLRPSCVTLGGEDYGYSLKGCSFTFAEQNTGYYMIDKCPQASDGLKSMYDDLCREEWNGQNDVMPFVPVTSLSSRVTYKNFYCFRCNELSDDYLFWDIRAKFNGDTDRREEEVKYFPLEYDRFNDTWVAPIGKRGKYIAVDLVIEKPYEVYDSVTWCLPNLVSECSIAWREDTVRSKCADYMYVIRLKRNDRVAFYRNPHCALCNFEGLKNMECPSALSDEGWTHTNKRPFSFTFLLDINRSSGETVAEIQRCKENVVWDPYFKKCREIKCALPGFKVRGGKCVPPNN